MPGQPEKQASGCREKRGIGGIVIYAYPVENFLLLYRGGGGGGKSLTYLYKERGNVSFTTENTPFKVLKMLKLHELQEALPMDPHWCSALSSSGGWVVSKTRPDFLTCSLVANHRHHCLQIRAVIKTRRVG